MWQKVVFKVAANSHIHETKGITNANSRNSHESID